jgi:hypothetical protein
VAGVLVAILVMAEMAATVVMSYAVMAVMAAEAEAEAVAREIPRGLLVTLLLAVEVWDCLARGLAALEVRAALQLPQRTP